MRLLSHGQVARGIFLDSDNFQDLSFWFGAVARQDGDARCAVHQRDPPQALVCRGGRQRACTASIQFLCPDFGHPSHTFIENCASVEGSSRWLRFGISLNMVQQTL